MREFESLPNIRIWTCRRATVSGLSIVLCLIMLGACGSYASGQIPVVQYNLLDVPNAQPARRKLQQPIRFVWDQQALRAGLQNLSKAHRINLWVDRRLDPTQPVSYAPPVGDTSPHDSMLLSRLQQLAAQMNASAGVIENLVYFGPSEHVEQIQRAAVVLHNTISQQDSRLANEARLLKWPELTTPQALLEIIEQQWSIQIEAKLPHDLMHAGELQTPSALATQLTIAAAGFDMEVEMVGHKQFKLVPLQKQSKFQAEYAKASIEADAIAELRRLYPGSQLKCRAARCTATGVANYHFALFAVEAARTAADERRWSLNVPNAPTSALMDRLAAGIGLQVTWDPACTDEHRNRLQVLEIKDASTQELLEKVCAAAGLSFRLEGDQLTLFPK
ncbi:MAG: hypothetical protein R3C53_10660 [Pirellulaceae bacterium]